MKRFQSYAELVTEASKLCNVWHDIEGKPVTILELVDSAGKNPDLIYPQSYVLSEEGAIGAADRYEYTAAWILVPMEDCEEKEILTEKITAYFRHAAQQ